VSQHAIRCPEVSGLLAAASDDAPFRIEVQDDVGEGLDNAAQLRVRLNQFGRAEFHRAVDQQAIVVELPVREVDRPQERCQRFGVCVDATEVTPSLPREERMLRHVLLPLRQRGDGHRLVVQPTGCG
jgi:hypothetical protein